MKTYRYFAFGLRLESTRPISALENAADAFEGAADVEIREGEIEFDGELHQFDGVQIGISGDACLLDIESCGRFKVTAGRQITIEPDPAATREQVDLYLLGSVFGALLHQRGIVPFHCNAVEIDGSAFLFCGESGAGKSTLAAHFVDRGFRLLSDDVCGLTVGTDGQVLASAGIPRLKLWQDALERFGRSTSGLALVPWYEEKFEVPLTGAIVKEPLPVAAIYHLRAADGGRFPGIHPLKGLAAANSITANIYRRRLADLNGVAPAYLATTRRLIEQVPVFTINRVWGFAHFQDEADAAERHMRKVARDSSDAGQASDGTVRASGG